MLPSEYFLSTAGDHNGALFWTHVGLKTYGESHFLVQVCKSTDSTHKAL